MQVMRMVDDSLVKMLGVYVECMSEAEEDGG